APLTLGQKRETKTASWQNGARPQDRRSARQSESPFRLIASETAVSLREQATVSISVGALLRTNLTRVAGCKDRADSPGWCNQIAKRSRARARAVSRPES